MTLESFKEGKLGVEVISEKDIYSISRNIFGFNTISGLPCGELRNFISESNSDNEVIHLPTTNEREAVGIAQGAWLAGRTPVLYMQNSGLFEASNDLGSLLIPSRIPVLFVVSWRGAPGENATQHLCTGKATKNLLRSFEIPYTDIPTKSNLDKLAEAMKEKSLPGVILLEKEKFNSLVVQDNSSKEVSLKQPEIYMEKSKGNHELSREEVLNMLFSDLINTNDATISSTGLISRSIYQNFDSDNQFYNSGAFGLTSMIALGFAVHKKDIKTIAIEGDGSVLTNLGALNVIANYGGDNFIHIVLDNNAYMSCSGEKTFGSEYIPQLASILGYKNVYSVFSKEELETILERVKENCGPQMVHININRIGERNFRRPLEMASLARRFRKKFDE